MATEAAQKRLQREYLNIVRDPPKYITARPSPANILEWHFCVTGPEDSVYKGGYYHGKLIFPREYPFRPPSILMITPSGRFKPNMRLCLSLSDFHPELWNPNWGVTSALVGLLSFMLETTPTTGSMETSDQRKRFLAWKSAEFNIKNPKFREMFPELTEELEAEAVRRRPNEQSKSALKVEKSSCPGAMDRSNGLRAAASNVLLALVTVVLALAALNFVTC